MIGVVSFSLDVGRDQRHYQIMNAAEKTAALENISNRCASAIARIVTLNDEYFVAAVEAEVEMSIILEDDAELAAEWSEVLSAHREAIASY